VVYKTDTIENKKSLSPVCKFAKRWKANFHGTTLIRLNH